MELREMVKTEYSDECETYYIGFINELGCEDATTFDVESGEELIELFEEFCKENGYNPELVTYLEREY